jgi:Holliday junction resolvase RusA-like endonuclease
LGAGAAEVIAPPVLEFTVYGKAQPAGSKRAFKHPTTGRVMVTDAAKGSRAWKEQVSSAAAVALANGKGNRAGELLVGPLAVAMRFEVVRPASHYGKRGLRSSAPKYPTTRPDVLKLARAVEDALTGVVWRDDALIVDEQLVKRYGEQARLVVFVAAL